MLASKVMIGQQGVSFTAFVVSLGTTAAVHLGDVADPQTGEKHVQLPAAAQMIEILAMLQEKTHGNLTEEESRLVGDLLYDLRMRYVEVSASAGGDAGPRIVTP
jgi:hypothetical protein